MPESEKVSEEHNENFLKNTAITFSMEGLSKDLDKYLQKKITFNTRSLKYVTLMVSALSDSKSKVLQRMISNKSSEINKLLTLISNESSTINGILDFIIQRIMNNEDKLNSEYVKTARKEKRNHE
jgi:hypothetical protein